MLVGSGGAAKTLGTLLARLAALKGEESAREAWAASGESLPAFLPAADRGDAAALQLLVERHGLAAVVVASSS